MSLYIPEITMQKLNYFNFTSKKAKILHIAHFSVTIDVIITLYLNKKSDISFCEVVRINENL